MEPIGKNYQVDIEVLRIIEYLGNQFRTDMVVYEITLDAEQINVEAGGLWIRRAGQTLAEAMTLAGGHCLPCHLICVCLIAVAFATLVVLILTGMQKSK